jgi:serine/threonine protein kinase
MGSADAPVEIDGFTELRLIGSGSASQVYSGYQPLLDRRVALKVFTNSTIDDATRSRFERESALMGALGEVRGVVTVYATTFTREGRPVIVMRLIGQSLGELLAEHGARPVEEVFRGALDLGAGLSHAHGSGVVHRDIKPENVLVDEEGRYWLADFGIAAVGVADLSVQTQGAMTPAHAPPERFTSSQPERDVADWMAGDLWSLGSTLYTALCGRPPFGSPSDPGGMAAMMQRLIEMRWCGLGHRHRRDRHYRPCSSTLRSSSRRSRSTDLNRRSSSSHGSCMKHRAGLMAEAMAEAVYLISDSWLLHSFLWCSWLFSSQCWRRCGRPSGPAAQRPSGPAA